MDEPLLRCRCAFRCGGRLDVPSTVTASLWMGCGASTRRPRQPPDLEPERAPPPESPSKVDETAAAADQGDQLPSPRLGLGTEPRCRSDDWDDWDEEEADEATAGTRTWPSFVQSWSLTTRRPPTPAAAPGNRWWGKRNWAAPVERQRCRMVVHASKIVRRSF